MARPRRRVAFGVTRVRRYRRNLSDLECVNIATAVVWFRVGFAPYLRPLDAAMMAELRALWRRFGGAADSIGAALSWMIGDRDREDDKF